MSFFKKNKRLVIQTVVILGSIIAILAIILIAASSNNKGVDINNSNNAGASIEQSNPSNMLNGGIVVSKDWQTLLSEAPKNTVANIPSYPEGKLTVTIYVDYLCPFCQKFEATNNSVLEKWIDSGKVNVEYRPIAFLSKYSAVAANGMSCVADKDPQSFWAATIALFNNQPAETDGLVNDVDKSLDLVVNTLGEAKVSSDVITCAKKLYFTDWVTAITTNAMTLPIDKAGNSLQGTPTILFDGVSYPISAETTAIIFDKAIAEALLSKGIN